METSKIVKNEIEDFFHGMETKILSFKICQEIVDLKSDKYRILEERYNWIGGLIEKFAMGKNNYCESYLDFLEENKILLNEYLMKELGKI